MRNVVLVARDAAPSGCFKRLELILKERGFNVNLFIGEGKPLTRSVDEITLVASSADIVVLGMSSSEKLAKEEIAAAKAAAEAGIPFGFYADTFGAWNRPWFKELRGKTNFLFVLNEDEAKKAKLLFPNAKIIASGNPTWEEFYEPKFSYKEARERLAISNNEKMILVIGHKLLAITLPLIAAVVGACHFESLTDKKIKIFLSLHPADPNPPDFYGDIVKFSKIFLSVSFSNNLPINDIMPAADLVVSPALTPEIEAVYQRKPVITYLTEISRNRNIEVFGKEEWELCELGVSQCVYDNPQILAENILKFLTPGGNAPQREKQEKIFPQPKEKRLAIKQIIASLNKFV